MTKKNSKIDRKHLNVRENKENRRRFWNNRDGASVEADVCSSAPDVYRHFITSCKFTHMEAATVTHTPLSVRHRPPSVVHLRLRRPQVSLQRPHQRKHANSRRSRQILGINFRNKSSQFFFCFVHPIRSQNSRRRRVLLLPRPLTNSHSFSNKSIMCGEHEETRG